MTNMWNENTDYIDTVQYDQHVEREHRLYRCYHGYSNHSNCGQPNNNIVLMAFIKEETHYSKTILHESHLNNNNNNNNNITKLLNIYSKNG